MARVLGETLDRQYEDLDSEGDFAALVDTMAAGRDDSRLEQIVLDVFGRIQSHHRTRRAGWQTRAACGSWMGSPTRGHPLGVRCCWPTPGGRGALPELLLRALELTGRDSVLSQNYGPSLSQSIQGCGPCWRRTAGTACTRPCQWSSQRRGGKKGVEDLEAAGAGEGTAHPLQEADGQAL